MNEVKRAYTLLVAATVVLYLFVFGVSAYGFYVNRSLAKQGDQAHNALCAYQTDLRKRVRSSVEFLDKNPRGIPGIPANLIINSIKNQQSTLKSLDRLQCP